ncbi:unnamed protein product [Rotaria sordida]|uniref:Uncharacterized protein n=1 Tax=Rotaria sordida TaxID=392033 RepID=A0A819QTV2_9BILA|nr:unnamed protein product [Rotaria sordida]
MVRVRFSSTPFSKRKCSGQEYLTPFNSSSSIFTKQLNVFWSIYGNCEEKLDTNDNCFGDNPAWVEWDALKFSSNNRNEYRDHGQTKLFQFSINGINETKGELSDGFIWSWLDSERWPDARGSHELIASYHFDQLPRFVIAIYQYYVWTHDQIFLQSILSRVELIMNFLIVHMNGSLGIPINIINDVISEKSRPSTYMDQLSKPANPILIGPPNGSTDVYHNVIGPRITAENVAQSDWNGWSNPTEGRRPYGGLVESAGTMM